MIDCISVNGRSCAIVLRAGYRKDGIQFFTKQSESLQLGYMSWPARHKISPHVHKPVIRTVEFTHEVLFVKSGKVKVNFYDDECVFSCSTIICAGDVILLTHCGHGFEMLEDSELIEVKQGPYAGENDKRRFSSEGLGGV